MAASENEYSSEEDESTLAVLKRCVIEKRIDVLRSVLIYVTIRLFLKLFVTASKPDFSVQVDGICCKEGTLLHLAVALESLDAVRTLLSSGVNPCVQNHENKTPFQMALSKEIREAFIQEFLQATAHSNSERVCQMLNCGVSVNATDGSDTQNTALHWAASFGNEEIIGLLLDNGADINAVNSKGETSLHDAVRRNHDGIVRLLLLHGADPSVKDKSGIDCLELATKAGSAVLRKLNMSSSASTIRRSSSIDSDFDRFSIMSTDTVLFADRTAAFSSGKIECWTDLLWPQPKFIRLDQHGRSIPFPKDNRLKIYFDSASKGEPRKLMQAIQVSAPLLVPIGLELEYRGHKILDHSSLEGRITCGIFDLGGHGDSYTLSVTENGIELVAGDYSGIRYGFATIIQLLRICSENAVCGNVTRSSISTSDITPAQDDKSIGHAGDLIPYVTIRDSPDMNIRAVYQDFSGCRILNTETVLELARRIGYCKANALFLNFEVRTTDRYHLPFTNRDLFHMTQICEELFVELIPSLDLQSHYVEFDKVQLIIENFLDDFPLSKLAHFGPNISSILISNRRILDGIQRRVSKIFLSVDVDEKNAFLVNQLPPYVSLCIDGKYPFDVENLLSARLNVVLKFTTSDPGYLCSDLETVAKKAILTAKLGSKVSISGAVICDLSTGCEIIPTSMAFISEIAEIGVSWNNAVDMRKFCFLLPKLTAEHVLLNGNMEDVFKQATLLGSIEHEVTRYFYGIDDDAKSAVKKMPISVFVEMILNPNNMALERPIIFKKARNELRRCLRSLELTKKQIPQNCEISLVLSEIQVVTELMMLSSSLGQSLCMYGSSSETGRSNSHVSPEDVRRKTSKTNPVIYNMVNAGIANLPFTTRTDLANSLLDIRMKFQKIWLSRNIASTLPNALKMCAKRIMPSFAILKEQLDASIKGVNRYNPNHITILEDCINAMVHENQYDKDILFTTLKLYQLNQDKFNEGVVKQILLKTMMMAPRSDFALAKYLIDANHVGSPELKRVFDIGALLESCNFAVFWKLMRGEYDPSDNPDEPFRNPSEIPKIIKAIPGFEESVRDYACQVIHVTFQNIEKSLLTRLLGGISGTSLNGKFVYEKGTLMHFWQKQVNEYARRYGWVPKDNGDVFFVQNHEGTIKSRNIEERLHFESNTFNSIFKLFSVFFNCV
uniref:Eukaryotic translation initiation factor 3 subunit K n=1 Tax=Syphacia muris TaxID=451379 RepID=A0A0N5AET5_9BILA